MAKLFEPMPPLLYAEPVDVSPDKRCNVLIDGVASYFKELTDYKNQGFVVTEGKQQQQQRDKREKVLKLKEKLAEDTKNWNPETDPQIRGNPYRTLFVGRLSYETTEIELQKEFSTYGPIERVRVVRDKASNKSKGYAFILFENERDLNQACKDASGKVINGRQIIVDVEKGRTVKHWKPRRIGGGTGGREYTQNVSSTRYGFGSNRPVGNRLTVRSFHDGYSRPRDSKNYGGNSRYQGRNDRDYYERERGTKRYNERERDSKPYGFEPSIEKDRNRDWRSKPVGFKAEGYKHDGYRSGGYKNDGHGNDGYNNEREYQNDKSKKNPKAY